MKLQVFTTCCLMVLLSTSCSNFFEVDADDMLKDEDYIGESNELYSGYMGIAAKVQDVADHAIFLAELRGDLLEPTANAPQDLWDIYRHRPAEGNPFASPRGYYNVILNANNYIHKAMEYRVKYPRAVDEAHFGPLISGAIRFKVWAYLMLGKLYGEAAYTDEPNVTLDNLSGLPVLSLDELIPKLIQLMEVGVNGFNGKLVLNWGNVLFPGVTASEQDLVWNMICPSPEPLLMELYLWAGQYSRVVEIGMPFIYDNGGNRYKIGNDDYNAEWVQVFTRDPVTKTRVLINIVPFDFERNQTNRLIRYFSNTYPSVYYLKPTQVAMDRFRQQVRLDGHTIGDLYRGENYTFTRQNGDWVIRKFSRDRETASEIHKNNVHIVLYRDSDVHFFILEALNQLELFDEAEALLNDGINLYLSRNSGNLQYPFNNEAWNAALTRNWGIRRRIDLGPVYPAGLSKAELDTPEKVTAYKRALDELIVEETCMESAGEAKSYFAMIRIAKRWNDPAILADRVSAKYEEGMRQTMRDRLMDPQNWFVRYSLSGIE
ncbi:RagB/SusD family protein [Parapedobacter tibetensis]|uniref:RagB/SusD family protein n=1 Tax=Parapedobacter tibetensis TaxID=2972951 RepID=UPI00214D8A55|nr:RagB/SusD family protein [Parapedobacter tibetensis]